MFRVILEWYRCYNMFYYTYFGLLLTFLEKKIFDWFFFSMSYNLCRSSVVLGQPCMCLRCCRSIKAWLVWRAHHNSSDLYYMTDLYFDSRSSSINCTYLMRLHMSSFWIIFGHWIQSSDLLGVVDHGIRRSIRPGWDSSAQVVCSKTAWSMRCRWVVASFLWLFVPLPHFFHVAWPCSCCHIERVSSSFTILQLIHLLSFDANLLLFSLLT